MVAVWIQMIQNRSLGGGGGGGGAGSQAPIRVPRPLVKALGPSAGVVNGGT